MQGNCKEFALICTVSTQNVIKFKKWHFDKAKIGGNHVSLTSIEIDVVFLRTIPALAF